MTDTEPTPTKSSPAEACRMGIALAKHGAAVFPCLPDKRPACPHGFKDASRDAQAIRLLWDRWPAPLIGIATGAPSGLWVVDIDSARHFEAWQWWQTNCDRIPETRTYQTRSGGLHLYFRQGDGVGNTASRICKGIDTRGDGGYVIYWAAEGCEVLDHAPACPFPDWLRAKCLPPPALPKRAWAGPGPGVRDGITGICQKLAGAAEGERNRLLFWSANRLREKGLGEAAVLAALLPIATGLGLPDAEVRRTIASATQGE